MINLKGFCTFDVYSSYVEFYWVFNFSVLLWVAVSLDSVIKFSVAIK